LLRLFGTWSMNANSFNKQVSLIHASSLSDHSVSNHLMDPCRRFRTLPLSSTAFRFRFRLRHCYAGSPISPGRIEFVILRTGRSPPAALHLASRRRSCSRLQAGERIPEEDFHLSDHSRFQAHIAPGVSPGFKSERILRALEEGDRNSPQEFHLSPFRGSRVLRAPMPPGLRPGLLLCRPLCGLVDRFISQGDGSNRKPDRDFQSRHHRT
jgi:hypothetical protein